ncbi:ABC transporter transmembrane domain-containing protein [Paenibacillus planticolens]|uniref:ABC transporter transmembrane domain-containing protein n=1 Tax=Paenibacillus planticolens TaxID=2654976 RepID=UPI001492274C|nr:ABC transporter transmembrane domain-containing protein [Paenibacillus planticolens]
MPFIKTMLRHCAQHKLLSVLFLGSMFIEIAYAVASPLSLKYLVDDAFTPKDLHAFIFILTLLLCGGFLNICASAMGDYSLGKLSGEFIRKLRVELFDHMQKQSLPFYQRYKVGDLVTRFAADMGAMERVVRITYPFMLKEALSVVLGLAMLFAINWKLTLAMLAGSLLMLVGPKLLQGRAEAANAGYKDAQERFANTIDEIVKGHKTIKSLHQQASIRERARRQMKDLFTFGFKLHMTGSLIERLPLTALLILNGIMIGFGGYFIFNDEITVGGFMAFFTLFMAVGQSGSNLSALIPNVIDASISFRRVGEIFEQQPDVPEAESPLTLPSSFTSVRMDRVTFGYTEDSDQLREVSLDIRAGTYVALVGPSGSGKSTALQLISRFYDPKEGTVSINNCDLRDVSEASLRKLSTLVAQDTFLFNATIRDNLLLDNPDATEADMVEAAKQAKIHDLIAGWPGGYDTLIHHEGGSLSGGERQRLSIARALLRKPKLLLLDEVTSALDPGTEAEINGLIGQSRKDKTIISVTHRLASVVQADAIYVFKEGRIVERGTHRELLEQNGHYAGMWEKQMGFHLSQDGLHATVDVDRLAKLPFFHGIERSFLGDIATLFTTEMCKEGEAVVREGEEGNKCYIIVRGKFEVLKHVPGKGEIRVAALQDGDHFGEVALLRNTPRNATVKALSPAVLLSVRREAFHRLTDEHPQIVRTLEQTLASRL